MKVLTIKEPWASLIKEGYKEYEFRTWETNYRGKILIHTSMTTEEKFIDKFKKFNLNIQTSKIIAEATIVDCIPLTKELNMQIIKENTLVYGHNKNRTGYAWKLKDVKPLHINKTIKGKLGLWNIKDEDLFN